MEEVLEKSCEGKSRELGVAGQRGLKLGCFVLWLGLVLLLAWHHAFWRDEVRALSLSLQGSSIVEMLEGMRGDGHPAIWYLLLRGMHAVVGSPVALPIASISVAAAATLLLVLRSPFNAWMVALLLLGNFALFEYSVMARNYGISVLFMFLLADCYPRYRDRGVMLGILLFLLANTNAHSVLLAGSFLMFWLIDLVIDQGVRWTPALRNFLLNAAIFALGVAVCYLTIYPPANDAAVIDRHELSLAPLAKAVVLPSIPFSEMVLDGPWRAFGLDPLPHAPWLALRALTAAVLFGSVLGLIRLPGAFVAALASLVAFSLFFVVIYPGAYRHEALWLVFLMTLYWIMLARGVTLSVLTPVFGRLTRFVAPASVVGLISMVALLALQVPSGLAAVADVAFDRPPFSRGRDFSAFVLAHPDLRDAVIIGDPDYLLEALPYYLPNPTYLLREQRFGRVVRFTRNARLSLSLDDILTTARALQAETGRQVLILMARELDPSEPAQTYKEGYNWELRTSPEQVSEFLRATRRLASFSPARSDESFDVYSLDQRS